MGSGTVRNVHLQVIITQCFYWENCSPLRGQTRLGRTRYHFHFCKCVSKSALVRFEPLTTMSFCSFCFVKLNLLMINPPPPPQQRLDAAIAGKGQVGIFCISK